MENVSMLTCQTKQDSEGRTIKRRSCCQLKTVVLVCIVLHDVLNGVTYGLTVLVLIPRVVERGAVS